MLLVAKVEGVEGVLEVRWVVLVVNNVGRKKSVREVIVILIVNVLKKFIIVTTDAMVAMGSMAVMVDQED